MFCENARCTRQFHLEQEALRYHMTVCVRTRRGCQWTWRMRTQKRSSTGAADTACCSMRTHFSLWRVCKPPFSNSKPSFGSKTFLKNRPRSTAITSARYELPKTVHGCELFICNISELWRLALADQMQVVAATNYAWMFSQRVGRLVSHANAKLLQANCVGMHAQWPAK